MSQMLAIINVDYMAATRKALRVLLSAIEAHHSSVTDNACHELP